MANPDIQETQQHQAQKAALDKGGQNKSEQSQDEQHQAEQNQAEQNQPGTAKKDRVAGRVSALAGRVQGEMPFALIQGEPLTVVPQDLYIPPDALEVILEAFEGPLDLLLYLIKRQNIDILDIPLEETTRQYMQYIDLMQNLRIELASEYLLMAAMLAEIKSRMLLPRPAEREEEDDPRAELIRRLQEYERFKDAAQNLDELPRVNRDFYLAEAEPPEIHQDRPVPQVDLRDLLFAFKDAMARADMYSHHHIQREALSVRERMSKVLSAISSDGFTCYTSLFSIEEGRRGVVVTLLAILELVKEQLIDLVQSEAFAPIHLKAVSSQETASKGETHDDNV
jgi:segregation and condensation protein A